MPSAASSVSAVRATAQFVAAQAASARAAAPSASAVRTAIARAAIARATAPVVITAPVEEAPVVIEAPAEEAPVVIAAPATAEEAPTDCDICTDPFNLSTRKAISCVRCDLICCKRCFIRYVTDPEHYLRCMGCGVDFDRTSLSTRMGKSFMATTFRDIRQAILYEQEKALFPATQELVETEKRRIDLRKQRDELDGQYEQIRQDRTKPLMEFRTSEAAMSAKEALDTYFALLCNVQSVDSQLQEARVQLDNDIANLSSKPTKRTYVLTCPATDCKGMLSSENVDANGRFNCAICTAVTCQNCQMECAPGTSATHECDPDVLATVAFVRETSKPCPSCGVAIHKTFGCSQMFCTSCHTSFEWKTGRINNGAIHNPYHAQWIRETRGRAREVGDVQCGREVSVMVLADLGFVFETVLQQSRLTKKEMAARRADFDYLFEAGRVCIHVHHVTLPSLARSDTHLTNQRLRMNLLMGRMSEVDFKSEIQRVDKAASKKNDMLFIATTFRDSFTDVIWPFVEGGEVVSTLKGWLDMIEQVRALERYINGCFDQVAAAYGSKSVTRIMSIN